MLKIEAQDCHRVARIIDFFINPEHFTFYGIDRVQILYLSMLTDCICTLFVFINVMLVYSMWENKIPVHEYVHKSWHTCFCYGYGHITIIL